jgi:hypothetical protein
VPLDVTPNSIRSRGNFEAGASPLHAVDRYDNPFRASHSGL